MKKQTISAQMSSPKYNALTYYLEKQNKTLEAELREHLDELYREQVPKDVQEYITSMYASSSLVTSVCLSERQTVIASSFASSYSN